MPATRTLASYQAIVQHALGDDPSTGFTTLEIVRDAFRWLQSHHPWNWRTQGPTTLSLVQDQDYVDLPADFGELISMEYPGTTIREMNASTIHEIEDLRAFRNTTPQYAFWYAINTGAIDTANPQNGLAAPRMEIWPNPEASVADALRVYYRRDMALLTNPTDIPQFPDWIEPIAVLAVRHYAYIYEDDKANNAAFEAMQSLLPDAYRRDGADQRRKGVMRGGLYNDTTNVSPFYPDQIADPT
jgi:hypothetical protein